MNPRTASRFAIAISLIVIACGIVLLRQHHAASSSAKYFSKEKSASMASMEENGRKSSGSMGRQEARRERDEMAALEWDKEKAFNLDRAASIFEPTKRDLVNFLELNAAQAEELEKIFSQRQELLASLLTERHMGEEGNNEERLAEICALLRNKGLREDLMGVLSARQLATYDANETRRAQEIIEARAYRDMAAIHAVLQISDSQKQEVLGVLLNNAPEKVEMEANVRAIMTLTHGPRAYEMDSSNFRRVLNHSNNGLMTRSASSNMGIDRAEFIKQAEAQKAQHIESELFLLRDVLDEAQLIRYRNHLEKEPAW